MKTHTERVSRRLRFLSELRATLKKHPKLTEAERADIFDNMVVAFIELDELDSDRRGQVLRKLKPLLQPNANETANTPEVPDPQGS